jgi:predicted O-linked N-acetylglucosamine transferase (SPINDLY family)
VLELHDAARFDIHLYAYGDIAPDAAWRERLARCPATLHEIGALSDAQAAARIAHDGVHLLVDLKGYTTGTRLGITALRPAPVIVSWLGYPGSLGAPRLADYLIGDVVVTPPVTAAHYSETLALMPHCYQPHDHRRECGPRPTRAEAGLPASGFVFCSFNQIFKLNARIASIWRRLLVATPGSVLWLLDPGEARARSHLHAFFAEQGVAAARVISRRACRTTCTSRVCNSPISRSTPCRPARTPRAATRSGRACRWSARRACCSRDAWARACCARSGWRN